jgi:hypothetical protein
MFADKNICENNICGSKISLFPFGFLINQIKKQSEGSF